MKIMKRNGTEAAFDAQKIVVAISKARDEAACADLSDEQIHTIAGEIKGRCEGLGYAVHVEDIQDMVEHKLIEYGEHDTAIHYIRYRQNHADKRNGNVLVEKVLSIVEGESEEANQENSNKNPLIASTQRDYVAGEISRFITDKELLPKEISEAHEQGIIHFHDSDYFIQHMFNCCLLNLDDMLQNGTVISGTKIEKPHSFSTACNIATQIIAQVASNQYGGQSISLTHLAPFVEVSRQKILDEVRKEYAKIHDMTHNGNIVELSPAVEEAIHAVAEDRLLKEIRKGVQTIQYQVVTLMTTNGQAPFITVYMNLGEARSEQEEHDLSLIIKEVLNQRIEGVKNEQGVWVTPAFPKLIYVLDENNVYEGSKYWDLTVLAAKCTAKRMVPDYISAKIMRELKGDVYTCMGCRSFLTPDRFTDKGIGNIANAGNYEPGKHKYYGRFNQGVVTINLPDVGLSANGDFDAFWEIFDERLELCHRALRIRHDRLKGTLSDVSPIHWQNGALARLPKGEPIDKLLYNGYSTISLGYAGLYECVMAMTGESHTSDVGREFGLAVMQYMNDKCNQWKAAENIDYSLYGTPIESTTYKFAKCLKKRFGVIKGVTDRNYITNSYHVHVSEPIDAFDKLAFEAQFQALSPGGAISYVEVPNMQGNIEAVLNVMQFIYENIMYAELNTKSDYCQVCGWDGEIQIVEDDGKLVWECPNCHNRDKSKMNVARRTCGYIGTNDWNQGRVQEIKERVLHL